MLSTRAGLPHPVPTGPRLPTLCPACYQELVEGIAAVEAIEAGTTQVVIYCPHEAALCICTVAGREPLGYELVGPLAAEMLEPALVARVGGRAGAAGPSPALPVTGG